MIVEEYIVDLEVNIDWFKIEVIKKDVDIREFYGRYVKLEIEIDVVRKKLYRVEMENGGLVE